MLVLCWEHPKAHRKWFYGEAGYRTCDPWFTRHRLIPYTTAAFLTMVLLFVAFLGVNQFSQVGLRSVFWFYVGNTQRLTKSGFMEKLGIEPAAPGASFGGFPWNKPGQRGWFKICALVLCREHPKPHRKCFFGETGNRTCDPWCCYFFYWCFFFVAFLGINQFHQVGLRFVLVL